jgi:hypothetical protein
MKTKVKVKWFFMNPVDYKSLLEKGIVLFDLINGNTGVFTKFASVFFYSEFKQGKIVWFVKARIIESARWSTSIEYMQFMYFKKLK